MKYSKYLILILSIFLFKSYTVQSQEISKKEIDHAINKIAKLIEDNYVFIEKGKKIAAYLIQQHKKERFTKATNWKTFDSIATKSLQEFSHDGHLYLMNDPNMIKELLTKKGDINEDDSYSELKAIENNYGFKEVKILEGNIGYIRINEINITEKSIPFLFAAIQLISNTKALIIDLQNNGGGNIDTGPIFESIFLPKGTTLLEFKTRDGNSSLEKTVDWLPIKKYEKPLYIIVNHRTGSAAEYCAYTLQLRKRATIVGQASGGAANMCEFYPVNDQILISISTASPTIPGTEESWEEKGVQPNYVVEKGQEINFILNLINKSKSNQR